MNTNLSTKQVEIIMNLLIDNNLLYEEAQETFLIFNEKFSNRLESIIHYCHELYIESEAQVLNTTQVFNLVVGLVKALNEYCEDYESRDNIFKDGAYKTMNSFFDRTYEAFEEFVNTL